MLTSANSLCVDSPSKWHIAAVLVTDANDGDLSYPAIDATDSLCSNPKSVSFESTHHVACVRTALQGCPVHTL
eukprot:748290-Rhodomonas_salina.4